MKKYFLLVLFGLSSGLYGTIVPSIIVDSQSVLAGQTIRITGNAFNNAATPVVGTSVEFQFSVGLDKVVIQSAEPGTATIDNVDMIANWSPITLNPGNNFFAIEVTFPNTAQGTSVFFIADGNSTSLGFVQATSVAAFLNDVPVGGSSTTDVTAELSLQPGTIATKKQPPLGTISTDGTNITFVAGVTAYDGSPARGIFTYEFSGDLVGVAGSANVTKAAVIPYQAAAFVKYYQQKYAPKVPTNKIP